MFYTLLLLYCKNQTKYFQKWDDATDWLLCFTALPDMRQPSYPTTFSKSIMEWTRALASPQYIDQEIYFRLKKKNKRSSLRIRFICCRPRQCFCVNKRENKKNLINSIYCIQCEIKIKMKTLLLLIFFFQEFFFFLSVPEARNGALRIIHIRFYSRCETLKSCMMANINNKGKEIEWNSRRSFIFIVSQTRTLQCSGIKPVCQGTT